MNIIANETMTANILFLTRDIVNCTFLRYCVERKSTQEAFRLSFTLKQEARKHLAHDQIILD